MAKIIPFKAVRPIRDKVHLVATRPYYSYTKQILNAKLIENPYTFIHIINPEFRKSDKTEPNTVERFQKVNEKYKQFKADNILIQDKVDSFYVYRQTMNNHAFVGVVAGASVQEYLNGDIKIHEQTITEREQTFKTYLDVCEFNAEPVLLTHKKSASLNNIYATIMDGRAEYEYTTTDKIKHEVWIVKEEKMCSNLSAEFAKMDSVYIADGHHRSASSALLGCDRKMNCENENGEASHDYFMAYFISEDLLKIHDYNRLVNNLNGHSASQVISILTHQFEVSPPSKKEITPSNKYQFSMYMEGSWYRLDLITKPTSSKPVDHLSPQLLSDYVLEPIFGIKDLKTNPDISFLSGKAGMKGLKKKVDKGPAKVAFGLFPVSVQELMTIADNKGIMPPKSTYIEPKLRSGLTIYEL